jgi:hypothetical protein
VEKDESAGRRCKIVRGLSVAGDFKGFEVQATNNAWNNL